MSEDTCDFGYGPVPAHRHPNGGGWVANTARVDGSAFVGGNAQVFGDAQVSGNARVFGDLVLVRGHAFATKANNWEITEVPNDDGTVTLVAIAEFEPVACPHRDEPGPLCRRCGAGLEGDEGK